MCDNAIGWISCVFISIGLILFVVLLPLSFQVIQHDQFGIKYNKVSREVDTSKIYTEGRNYITPGETIFVYSRRFNTVDFSQTSSAVDCLSNDGIYVTLQLTFQYQIIQADLFDILFEFGQMGDYDSYVQLIAKESIRQTCSYFPVAEFAIARGDVATALQQNLTAMFNTSNAHCVAGLLQLSDVQYPQAYSDAIAATQRAQQDYINAVNERPNQLVQANTTLSVANYTAYQNIVAANASATAVLQLANADALAITQTWIQRANAYKDVMLALNMNSTEFVNVYFKSYILQQLPNPVISFT